MTTREPRWTDRDVDELAALAEYRSQQCPCGCGFPIDDTTSHETGGPRFTAEHVVCRARLALVEAQRLDEGKKPSPAAAARLWTVRKG